MYRPVVVIVMVRTGSMWEIGRPAPLAAMNMPTMPIVVYMWLNFNLSRASDDRWNREELTPTEVPSPISIPTIYNFLNLNLSQ
jgi:hypothetical protein